MEQKISCKKMLVKKYDGAGEAGVGAQNFYFICLGREVGFTDYIYWQRYGSCKFSGYKCLDQCAPLGGANGSLHLYPGIPQGCQDINVLNNVRR